MSDASFGSQPNTGQASVTTTAAAIATKPTAGTTVSRAHTGVLVKALPGNGAVVYVGANASLTSSNGYPLAAGDAVALNVDDPSRIFAVAASGTQTLAYLYV